MPRREGALAGLGFSSIRRPHLALLIAQPLVELDEPRLAKVVDDEKASNHGRPLSP